MDTELQQDVDVRSWVDAAFRVSAEPGWCVTAAGYVPALEHERETRLVIGNGFLGVRGSLEIPTPASRPRTFVAGLFDTDPGPPLHSALVSGPDWLRLRITVGATPVTLDSGEIVQHQRTLDLRRGVLLTEWRQRLPMGQTISLRALRCVSLADRAIALQRRRRYRLPPRLQRKLGHVSRCCMLSPSQPPARPFAHACVWIGPIGCMSTSAWCRASQAHDRCGQRGA